MGRKGKEQRYSLMGFGNLVSIPRAAPSLSAHRVIPVPDGEGVQTYWGRWQNGVASLRELSRV